MGLSTERSERLAVLVRLAFGLLVALFALASLDGDRFRVGASEDPLASSAPLSAACLPAAWKAVRPQQGSSARSQNAAIPFSTHSSGNVGIIPVAMAAGWLAPEPLAARTMSGSHGHLDLRTHNPRAPPAFVPSGKLA
jgi:hypothetical protein